MPKKLKILLCILIPLSVVFSVALGLLVHFYNFPTWTNEVEDMAMEYLKSQEELYQQYCEDAVFRPSGMSYNTKTRNSVVNIKVNRDLYHVTVDCIDGEFVIRGYEKAENTQS